MLRYFPHETKATRREDLRMENEPCRWSFVYRNPFIGRALVDALTSVPLKSGSPLSPTLSLLSAWKSRASLKIGATPKKLAALTSRPSLKIEPTSRQISEETLGSLKLRERNFKHQTTPEQPVKPTEGHPQSDVTQRHAGFPARK